MTSDLEQSPIGSTGPAVSPTFRRRRTTESRTMIPRSLHRLRWERVTLTSEFPDSILRWPRLDTPSVSCGFLDAKQQRMWHLWTASMNDVDADGKRGRLMYVVCKRMVPVVAWLCLPYADIRSNTMMVEEMRPKKQIMPYFAQECKMGRPLGNG